MRSTTSTGMLFIFRMSALKRDLNLRKIRKMQDAKANGSRTRCQMKLVFCGTPAFAVPSLEALLEQLEPEGRPSFHRYQLLEQSFQRRQVLPKGWRCRRRRVRCGTGVVTISSFALHFVDLCGGVQIMLQGAHAEDKQHTIEVVDLMLHGVCEQLFVVHLTDLLVHIRDVTSYLLWCV